MAGQTQDRPALAPPPRWGGRHWAIALAIGTAALGVGVAVDMPMHRWHETFPFELNRTKIEGHDFYFFTLQAYVNPVSVTAIVLAIVALDRRWRQVVTRMLLAIGLASLAVHAIKLVVLRERPYVYDGDTWLGAWQGLGVSLDNKLASFPSGHTGHAFAMFGVLAGCYRPARWLCWALAAGVGLARWWFQDHWPSDIIAGALIGLAAAYLMLRGRRARRARHQITSA